jgi:tetratricopeptide (TPR) repeat protein
MDDVKSVFKNSVKPSRLSEGNMSTKGLDIIIVGIMSLIFFLSPLFFTGLASQGIGFEKMVVFYFLVLIGIVAWVTKGVIVGELNLKRTPLDLPILAVVAVFAVSTILSISAKDSLIGSYGNSAKSMISVVIFALFYYLAVNNIDTKKIKIYFWSLVASGCMVTVYSFLQLNKIFILPMDYAKSASFNPLGSLSGLTMYLVILLPLFIVAISQIKEIAPKLNNTMTLAVKIVLGIFALGAMTILALLNGFTFWPIAVVGIVIVLMFFLSKIIKITNNNLLIPLAAFLALIIFLVLGNFNILNLNLPAEVSLSRSASWDIAKSGIKANPIFGSGPSTFYYDFSKYKSINFNASPLWNVRFDSASGALFELLSTVGIVGAIAFAVLFLIGYSLSFLTLIKNEDGGMNSILLALFSSFVSAGLFAVLFALNNSLILFVVLISVLTVSASLYMYPEKFRNLKLSFRASPKYALALAAIFLCVSAGVVVLFTMGLKMYMGDVLAKKSLTAATTEEKINYLSRSIILAPYQDAYYLSLANNYMALANQEALGGRDQQKIQDNLSIAIERGKTSVDIAPNKAANNESLALIYENASFYTRGALEWAQKNYEKEIELEPNNPTPFLRLALVNMANANAQTDTTEKNYYINEAIKKYDEAIAKKSDLAAAHYGKGIAYEKLNNLNDAIDNLKKANLVARNNLDYLFELGRLFFNRGVIQPKLAQTDSKQIAVNDITPGGAAQGETGDNLSVQPGQATGGTIKRNDDLNSAEQIFLSILTANPNHANSLYSLAVLYQKIGDTDNTKLVVDKLLTILPDDATKNAVKEQFKGLF